MASSKAQINISLQHISKFTGLNILFPTEMKNACGNESLIFPIPDMGEKSKGNLRMSAWFGAMGLGRASHGEFSDLEIPGDGVKLRFRLTGNISAPSAGL